MQIYRINKETDEWLKKAYDYVRTDAFCFGQNIPVELEFAGEEAQDDLEGVVILEDHKPVAGCRISYPAFFITSSCSSSLSGQRMGCTSLHRHLSAHLPLR